MYLEVYEYALDDAPRLVAESPNEGLLEEMVFSLSWGDITFVILTQDKDNLFEVSGSHEDGFSARYVEDGQEFVSVHPPESLAEMVELLRFYLVGDERWRQSLEWE
jgi:hypothetical protein